MAVYLQWTTHIKWKMSWTCVLYLPLNAVYIVFFLLTYLCLFCAGQVVCSPASWVQLNGIFLQSCAAGPWPLWLWQDWTWFIMPSTEPYGMPSVPTGGQTECPSRSKFCPETTSIQSAEPRWDKRALKPSKDIKNCFMLFINNCFNFGHYWATVDLVC